MDYLRLFALVLLTLPIWVIRIPLLLTLAVTSALGSGAFLADGWVRATLLKPLGTRYVKLMKKMGHW